MSLVRQAAPAFTLEGVSAGEFVEMSLQDLRGQWTVLFFYPLDFTFVCPTEIKAFSSRHGELEELEAQVLGVSVDSKYSHLAWIERELGELAYPLLSDMTKEVSRAYGVLLEDEGVALRGLYIVDPEGVVRYELIHDLDVGRSVDETLRVLQALQTGQLCPMDWKPGEETLGEG